MTDGKPDLAGRTARALALLAELDALEAQGRALVDAPALAALAGLDRTLLAQALRALRALDALEAESWLDADTGYPELEDAKREGRIVLKEARQ